HEFRTPLTLFLGPVEEMLTKVRSGGTIDEPEQLEMAYRNSLRLLKLVNTLLDFSRIEAGRMVASYEPVDVAAYTAELSGGFCSAIERAGLRFVVDCQPVRSLVYLDREMWEKVIFNLISNALKFTFTGEISVEVRDEGEQVIVAVRDTGVGIP